MQYDAERRDTEYFDPYVKKEFLGQLRDSQILNKNSALWRKRVSEWVVYNNV